MTRRQEEFNVARLRYLWMGAGAAYANTSHWESALLVWSLALFANVVFDIVRGTLASFALMTWKGDPKRLFYLLQAAR